MPDRIYCYPDSNVLKSSYDDGGSFILNDSVRATSGQFIQKCKLIFKDHFSVICREVK